jgi:hypothetical protein
MECELGYKAKRRQRLFDSLRDLDGMLSAQSNSHQETHIESTQLSQSQVNPFPSQPQPQNLSVFSNISDDEDQDGPVHITGVVSQDIQDYPHPSEIVMVASLSKITRRVARGCKDFQFRENGEQKVEPFRQAIDQIIKAGATGWH